jgi:polyisoprenoid-binding protein YceI
MYLKPLLVSGAALILATTAYSADYTIDLSHSSASFSISHLGYSKTTGRFNEFEGTFSDTAGAESVEVTIKASTIDSNHEPRDKHLRSPDFFDVKQYPTITFKSTDVTETTLTGDLTMHGKTNSVTLDLVTIGEGSDPWGGYRKGYSATATINRSDWGMDYGIPGVGDSVDIVLEIEGVRQ